MAVRQTFEWAHRKEIAEHGETMVVLNTMRVITVVLLVVVGLLTWQLVT